MGWLEVISVDIGGQRARNTQIAFDERPINHELRLRIGELSRAPGLDLLPERLEIPLDPVDPVGRSILRLLNNVVCLLVKACSSLTQPMNPLSLFTLPL